MVIPPDWFQKNVEEPCHSDEENQELVKCINYLLNRHGWIYNFFHKIKNHI